MENQSEPSIRMSEGEKLLQKWKHTMVERDAAHNRKLKAEKEYGDAMLKEVQARKAVRDHTRRMTLDSIG